MRRAASRSLFDLAPNGVYPASAVTLGAVGSYPTISPLPLTRRYNFCGTFHPQRYRTGVPALTTERPALRSPDFPPSAETKSGRYTLPATEEDTPSHAFRRKESFQTVGKYSGVLRETRGVESFHKPSSKQRFACGRTTKYYRFTSIRPQ